jgi:hypothetical protein
VTINVDVRSLDLPEAAFTKLRAIVADLTALGVAETAAPTEGASS